MIRACVDIIIYFYPESPQHGLLLFMRPGEGFCWETGICEGGREAGRQAGGRDNIIIDVNVIFDGIAIFGGDADFFYSKTLACVYSFVSDWLLAI